jgi:two-component system sensor histidine kinase GlrK
MFALTRSMLSLIVASFLLVSAPLIAAVVSSFVNVTGLSRQADEALTRGVEIAQLSQAVVAEIHGMERNVRQYSVLGDADFLKFYQDRQQRLENTVSRLEELVGVRATTSELVAVRTQSREIYEQVVNATKPEERAAAVERFEPLQAAAAAWVTSGNEIIAEESAHLHASARETRDRVTRLLITTIPAALLMILLFTFLIVRPVRQLGRAIRAIGVGGKGNVIRVRGPADLAALGRELEALRLRLAATEQEKQIFLRHMSHELKTPLANLLEGTELLTDGSLGNLQDAQAEVSGILRGNAQELRHLIENLLDYSAWQEKSDRVERSDFELQVLCQQVLEQYRLTLLGKNVVIDQRIIPMRVSADREKLKTVLSNLISNAIKYSPQGGTVHLRALRLNGQLVFDVADTGPNVPVAERERIFEPFYTGAPPRQSHVRGTGIGLSLVREYVRAHGGQIELVDGVYTGAHFRLTLPLTTNGYAEPNTL